MTLDPQVLAERVVDEMLVKDAFSQWLGIRLKRVIPNGCRLEMMVRPDMLNGFGVCHGGVTFAFADSALAFASNTNGQVTLSIDNAIAYPAPIQAGDVLTADAMEESSGGRVAFFRVEVRNQVSKLVAVFRGTVYRTEREHDVARARA